MEFSRSWKKKQSINEYDVDNKDKYIIKSNKNFLVKILEFIFTSLLWAYTAIVFYFFISAFFNHNDDFIGIIKTALNISNNDIQSFIKISLFYFLISFFILYLWRIYNIKRFGSLNRRVYPENTTENEILQLDLVTPEVYKTLQNKKIIVFEENPIRDINYKGDKK